MSIDKNQGCNIRFLLSASYFVENNEREIDMYEQKKIEIEIETTPRRKGKGKQQNNWISEDEDTRGESVKQKALGGWWLMEYRHSGPTSR